MLAAGDDWYQRRRDDAEGEFFRAVSDQADRKRVKHASRQGIYCLTADGKLLGERNDTDPKRVLAFLHGSLKLWDELPAECRKPGAVTVRDPSSVDRRYVREPPSGGLVLRTHTRMLEQDADGKPRRRQGIGSAACRDVVWIRADELESFQAPTIEKDKRIRIPDSLADRLAVFHLVDNTQSEPEWWARTHLRKNDWHATAVETNQTQVVWQVEGHVLLLTDRQRAKAGRGFDAQIAGRLVWDRKKGEWTTWDVVIWGPYWNKDHKGILGIVMEKADSQTPAVPPQGARDLEGYLGRS